MKRYLYIAIGIIVAAAIVVLVLFLIKNNSGNSAGSLGVSNTTGSLPPVGTQTGNGTSGGSQAGNSTGAGTTTLSLPAAQNGTSSAGTAPTASGQMTVQAFGVLSNSPVLDYFVAPNNTITAVDPTGEIISIVNGQTTTINSSTIDDIISASFSYDGKKILVSYGDPSNPQTGVFDVPSDTWTAFPQGMQSPQWSPAANYQIAYLVTTNGGELALATIDAANIKKAPTTVLTLNASDLSLQWPTANEFILADKPSYQSDGSIWAFNAQAGTLTPLMYEVAGTEGIWSSNVAIPYGLIFTSGAENAGGGDLQLKAISGSLPTERLAFSTLPSKCTFNTEQAPVVAPITTASSAQSSATSTTKNAATSTPYLALYCGIPRPSSGFSSAHLPDDYDMMALFTSDDIYKVNTATGAEQMLWSDPTQNVDVSDMKFANNALFFVNRYDQRLYGLTFSQ